MHSYHKEPAAAKTHVRAKAHMKHTLERIMEWLTLSVQTSDCNVSAQT